MAKLELKLLRKILYEMDYNEAVRYISEIKNSKLLHILAGNYNWNDGFDIPLAIINNKHCDIGTALMIFEYSEGYIMFFDDKWKETLNFHTKFISNLKLRIETNDFKYKNIKFIPSLTKIEIFKLKKKCPLINKIFIEGTNGENIDIIII